LFVTAILSASLKTRCDRDDAVPNAIDPKPLRSSFAGVATSIGALRGVRAAETIDALSHRSGYVVRPLRIDGVEERIVLVESRVSLEQGVTTRAPVEPFAAMSRALFQFIEDSLALSV
jgi:hypothetical protein